MTAGVWEFAAVLAKGLGLLAMAGVVGGSFVLALARGAQFPELPGLRRYLLLSAVLGLLATPLYFLLQVGAVNQSGIPGMFDPAMGSILLQSGLGQVMALRMSGFALALCAVLLAACFRHRAQWLVGAVAALLLCASFVLTGHLSMLSHFTRALLALHVLAVLAWIGALYPLLLLSRTPLLLKIDALMRSFGMLALGIVASLLLSGLYLATQLLQAPGEFFSTAYGRTLLLKLTGVGVLLLLAATNKLVLVPKLLAADSSAMLQRSIRAEIVVAVLVLAVTSWLTTVTGPSGI